ncbi:MAG: hypothetical protein V4563_17145 [Pseudomonadota bacterium]
MASTWEEIFSDSLSLAGILGQGQIIDAAMLDSAKVRAKNLLDELDGEGIALPVFSTDVEFDTVSGQNKYVLGTGSDTSPANAIRPETIIDGEIEIQPGAQPVYLPLTEGTFPQYRKYISVPNNPGQPWNYYLNPGWPQADLYVWPTPNQVWKLRFTCKLKWVDTLGLDPTVSVYSDAALPSGFTNAFTNMLAYKLATWRRLGTEELKNASTQGKFVMATYTWRQNYALRKVANAPTAFPWNIIRAGMNP